MHAAGEMDTEEGITDVRDRVDAGVDREGGVLAEQSINTLERYQPVFFAHPEQARDLVAIGAGRIDEAAELDFPPAGHSPAAAAQTGEPTIQVELHQPAPFQIVLQAVKDRLGIHHRRVV